jgi:hypothetical protein
MVMDQFLVLSHTGRQGNQLDSGDPDLWRSAVGSMVGSIRHRSSSTLRGCLLRCTPKKTRAPQPVVIRSAVVTADCVARSMGLMDRDWYRADLAQRQRRRKWRGAVRGGMAATAIMLAALAILPFTLTSRCDPDGWQTMPLTCWRSSWTALSERVAGNMAATRGFPIVTVRVGH